LSSPRKLCRVLFFFGYFAVIGLTPFGWLWCLKSTASRPSPSFFKCYRRVNDLVVCVLASLSPLNSEVVDIQEMTRNKPFDMILIKCIKIEKSKKDDYATILSNVMLSGLASVFFKLKHNPSHLRKK
jgi:hypothetical protein